MKSALIFWFSGLSGSGKTTIAQTVKVLLEKEGRSVLILDGDDVRERFHKNLGFNVEDIKENNRLISELCHENKDLFDIILVPIISPYKESREKARELLNNKFYEVYVSASLKTVIARDTKGLYAKAASGLIDNLIGYSKNTIYEEPKDADLVINSNYQSVEQSVKMLYEFVIKQLKILS